MRNGVRKGFVLGEMKEQIRFLSLAQEPLVEGDSPLAVNKARGKAKTVMVWRLISLIFRHFPPCYSTTLAQGRLLCSLSGWRDETTCSLVTKGNVMKVPLDASLVTCLSG